MNLYFLELYSFSQYIINLYNFYKNKKPILKNRSKVQGKKNIKRRAQTRKNKDSAIYFTQNSTEIFKIKCEFNDNGIEIIDLTEIINLSEQENKNDDTNIFFIKKKMSKIKEILLILVI